MPNTLNNIALKSFMAYLAKKLGHIVQLIVYANVISFIEGFNILF